MPNCLSCIGGQYTEVAGTSTCTACETGKYVCSSVLPVPLTICFRLLIRATPSAQTVQLAECCQRLGNLGDSTALGCLRAISLSCRCQLCPLGKYIGSIGGDACVDCTGADVATVIGSSSCVG